MYNQFDGLRQFENPFSPHPEIFEYDPIFFIKRKDESQTYKETEKESVIQVEEKNELEQIIEEPKPETGLTVTNNVNYEIKDSEKKGFFKRR